MTKDHNTPKKFGPSIAEHVAMKDVGEIFGYRMMGTMDEYIVKAIEIRLNQFIGGVTAGLTRFVEEAAQEAVEEAVAAEIEKLVGKKEESKPEIASVASIDLEEKRIPNEVAEQEVLPILIPANYEIPRRDNGMIDWSSTDRRGKKRIVLFLIRVAKSRDVDISKGNNFKKQGSDFNAAYQKVGSLFGGWSNTLDEYEKALFEDKIETPFIQWNTSAE